MAQCLRAMEQLNVPRSRVWEIVVVDNASTDGTSAVIETIVRSMRLPLRTVVSSPVK
jgi:glycosyltransferase involved in cell wall biosynthesis